ncbi:hypothetical protein KC980_03035, partial [candidate division WWE3 bacterium]|nr:hypothetical protein [candidate division WWE3 bacterium]
MAVALAERDAVSSLVYSDNSLEVTTFSAPNPFTAGGSGVTPESIRSLAESTTHTEVLGLDVEKYGDSVKAKLHEKIKHVDIAPAILEKFDGLVESATAHVVSSETIDAFAQEHGFDKKHPARLILESYNIQSIHTLAYVEKMLTHYNYSEELGVALYGYLSAFEGSDIGLADFLETASGVSNFSDAELAQLYAFAEEARSEISSDITS